MSTQERAWTPLGLAIDRGAVCVIRGTVNAGDSPSTRFDPCITFNTIEGDIAPQFQALEGQC